MTTFEDIFEFFGSQTELAKELGVTRSAVNQWVKDDEIPAARAIQIENITGGKFKAIEMKIKTEK